MLTELFGKGRDCVSDVDERRVWHRNIFPAQRTDTSRNFPVRRIAEYQFGILGSPHHLSMEASVGHSSDPRHPRSGIDGLLGARKGRGFTTCVGVTPVA